MSKPKLKIPVAKIGTFYKEDPESPLGYKVVKFTQEDFDYMLTNPSARGYETPLRRGHNLKGQGIQDGETADAHLDTFVQEGDVLFGEFEANNDQVVEEIKNEEFRYASGEFIRNSLSKTDPTQRIPIFVKAVGLTNTPFLPDLPRATLINCSDAPDAFFRLSMVEAEDLSDAIVPQEQEEIQVPQSNYKPQAVKPAQPEEVQNLADQSLDDLRAEIKNAFNRSFCGGYCGDYCYCGPYVQAIYHEAGYLVAEKGQFNYRYDYTASDGTYSFSEPQKVVMQFEAVENLTDDLIPGHKDPIKRVERFERSMTKSMNSFFEKISNFITGKDLVSNNAAGAELVPVTVSLSDEQPSTDIDQVEPQPEEIPAAGEGQPEGDAPAQQPEAAPQEEPVAIEPTTEENEMNPEEIQAMKAELEAFKAKEAELEAERQSLADKAFEQSLSDFVAKATQLVTPAAAEKLATIIRANRSVEAFSLSEGQAPVSLDKAILEALSDAVPAVSATSEILGEQAGEQSLSDDPAAVPANPWADRIAALKAAK